MSTDATHQNQSMNNEKNNDQLNTYLSRFFKVIAIHKWLFIISSLLVIALVILYALRQPNSYQSNYEIFYNENVRQIIDNSNETVIKSDFDKNYWLRAMQSNEIMQITQKNSGLKYSAGKLSSMIQVGLADKRKEDRIPVYNIQISSEYKEHIQLIMRAYIKALNFMLIQTQVNNSQNMVNYLNEQIAQNNQKLLDFDSKLNSFGSESSEIIDYDKIKITLDDFRKQLLNAKVNLSAITSSRSRTQKELRNLDGTIVNESAFSEPLKVQLMNLEVDLARALTKSKDDHPAVKQIKENINQIRRMLKDSLEQRLEIKSMVQNPLKNQLMSKLLDLQIQEVSETSRLKSLEMVIQEYEKKIMPNTINQNHQQQLRNREMISMTIKQLNDRLIESQSVSHGSLSRFVFIDDPNSIYYTNKGLWFFLILALSLSIVIASLIVFIYDILDDRIMLLDDYEHFYKNPVLGIIRHYKFEEDKVIEPGSDYKYHSLNDIGGLIINLRQIIKHNHLKTIVVSSPERQEGKSMVSLKIAAALAMKKQKVLLVDMDFYSPKISFRLFKDTTAGLSNYILDEVGIDEIIQPTEIECLNAVAAGNADGQKDLFYNDSRLTDFINTVSNRYDVIIFDTPAAMYIPEIIEFYDSVDGVFFIVRLRRTTRKSLNRIFDKIKDLKGKYLGVIVNDMNVSSKEYYNKYEYVNNAVDADSTTKNRVAKKIKKSMPVKSIVFVILALVALSLSVYYFIR